MNTESRVLIADDDLEDCAMIKEAFHEGQCSSKLDFVHDGEELMNFVNNHGIYTSKTQYPSPKLILLDLNMPKKDGREVLREIKSNPGLRHIPVVILTTSESQDDISEAYSIGANSFITKVVDFNSLVEITKSLKHYWFDVVALPKYR